MWERDVAGCVFICERSDNVCDWWQCVLGEGMGVAVCV